MAVSVPSFTLVPARSQWGWTKTDGGVVCEGRALSALSTIAAGGIMRHTSWLTHGDNDFFTSVLSLTWLFIYTVWQHAGGLERPLTSCRVSCASVSEFVDMDWGLKGAGQPAVTPPKVGCDLWTTGRGTGFVQPRKVRGHLRENSTGLTDRGLRCWTKYQPVTAILTSYDGGSCLTRATEK